VPEGERGQRHADTGLVPMPSTGHGSRAAGADRTMPPVGEWKEDEGATRPGRRRLQQPATGRRPVVLAAVVALVVAVLAGVGWALSSGGPDPATGEPGTFVADDGSGTATGGPEATGSPAAATPTPPAASASPTPSPSRSAGPAAFGPVTYEAEASGNSLLGHAEVFRLAGASGGLVVRYLGDGAGTKRDGALRFNAVTVPEAGSYTLTLHYAQAGGPPAAQVTVTVAGGGTVTAAVGGTSTCCASLSVTVRLRAGANTVTITGSGGPAPAVDRIVVRRP
jgi:hypothetical protein